MARADWSLLLALVSGASGLDHLRRTKKRAPSIEMRIPFIVFLGAAECIGALGQALGFLVPSGAGIDSLDPGQDLQRTREAADGLQGREIHGLELWGTDDSDGPGVCGHGAGEVELVAIGQQQRILSCQDHEQTPMLKRRRTFQAEARCFEVGRIHE